MTKISDLFALKYGHSLELNRLHKSTKADAVNFVGRSAVNNGVTAKVSKIADVSPAAAGTLTVALNGQGGAGVAFVQPAPYYTAFHVMILSPKFAMTEKEKLWWAFCITANRFRYGFGRQANRTLKHLDLPDPKKIPDWVAGVDFGTQFSAILRELKEWSGRGGQIAKGTAIGSNLCQISDLFDVQYGTNLELLRLTKSADG